MHDHPMSEVHGSNERFAYAAYRRARYAWMLLLASTLHMFAIPLWHQIVHDQLADPALRHLDVEILVAPTNAGQWIYLWLPQFIMPIVGLVLAGTLPWLIHRWWLSRLNLRMVDGEIGQVATYRDAPQRQIFMHSREIHRFANAYGARLARLVILLVMSIIPTYNEAFPTFGGHYPKHVVFSPAETFMPLFVAAALILLANAPTRARFFGPYLRMQAKLDPEYNDVNRHISS